MPSPALLTSQNSLWLNLLIVSKTSAAAGLVPRVSTLPYSYIPYPRLQTWKHQMQLSLLVRSILSFYLADFPCFGSCCAKIPLPRQSVSTSLQTCHHSYNLLCQQNCKQAARPVWITKQFMICFCFLQSFPLSFLSLRRNWCSQDTALTSQASPEPAPSVPHNPCWRGHLCHWCSTWPKKHYTGGILAACCLWKVHNPAPNPLLPCLGPAPKAQSEPRLQSCRKGNLPVLLPWSKGMHSNSLLCLSAGPKHFWSIF